jgi:hypothetical protein
MRHPSMTARRRIRALLFAAPVAVLACASRERSRGGIAAEPAPAAEGPRSLDPIAVPLVGCPPFYTADVTVGGSESFRLVLDTGSASTAVSSMWCASCAHAKVTRYYRPAAGSVDLHQVTGTNYGTSVSVVLRHRGAKDRGVVPRPGSAAHADVRHDIRPPESSRRLRPASTLRRAVRWSGVIDQD